MGGRGGGGRVGPSTPPRPGSLRPRDPGEGGGREGGRGGGGPGPANSLEPEFPTMRGAIHKDGRDVSSTDCSDDWKHNVWSALLDTLAEYRNGTGALGMSRGR